MENTLFVSVCNFGHAVSGDKEDSIIECVRYARRLSNRKTILISTYSVPASDHDDIIVVNGKEDGDSDVRTEYGNEVHIQSETRIIR